MPAAALIDTGPTVWRSKLRPPAVRADYVTRPRLQTRFEAGLRAKLTLVCAPAGFGKTSLLAAWVRGLDRRRAWLALDAYDDDLTAFVRALVAAIRTAVPDAAPSTLSLLLQRSPPPVPFLAATLGNELADLEGELVVVLDDYHLLRDGRVHELLGALLRHLPGHVHFVIATREEPPLQLGALRARAELLELHAEDLRFTAEESQAFLAIVTGLADAATALELVTRTEGWAAGLRLLVAALPKEPAAPAGGRPPPESGRSRVREYLLEQVLSGQPEAVRTFLLQTSILDRFCGELCDAVVEPGPSPERGAVLLRRLEQVNCFLVPLDEERTWYRYHYLFREVLQGELPAFHDSARIEALHRRASGWLGGRGLTREAVRHALAAGDREPAARLIQADLDERLNREDWATVEAWLGELPHDLVREQPGLLLAHAWSLHFRTRHTAIPPVLERLETLLAGRESALDRSSRDTVKGTIEVLRCVLSWLSFDAPGALQHARAALERLPAGCAFARSHAIVGMSVASHWLGDGAGARRRLYAELAAEREPHPAYRARVLMALAYICAASADFRTLEQTARQLLALAETNRLPVSQAWAHFLLGLTYYEWDQIARAREHFSAAIALRDRVHAIPIRESRIGLALTSQASSSPGLADGPLQSALELAEQTQNQPDLAEIHSCQARLALAVGQFEAAADRMGTIETDAAPLHPWALEVPPLTRARLQVASGTEPGLHRAIAALEDQAQSYAGRRDTWRTIQARALQAVAYHRLGARATALDMLTQAVALAEPGGLVRTFVDLGPPMAELLAELAAGEAAPRYAGRLLAALRAGSGPAEAAVPRPAMSQDALVEPLTWREIEILRLLEARLSNKEIGSALVISTETVKKHAANLYRKLDVTGRREAAARARALGLLSGDAAILSA